MNHRNLIQDIYGVILYPTSDWEHTVWIGHIHCVLIASDLTPQRGEGAQKRMKIMKIQWHGLDCLVNKVRRKRTFNAHPILEMKILLPIEPYVDRMGF